MNQILCVSEKDKNRGSYNSNIKSIIKFFAVIIILFGIILAGEGIYSFFIEDNKDTITPTLTATANGSQVLLSVKYGKGIDKLVYSWNDGSESTIYGNGRISMEEYIDMPIGTNTLNLTLVDVESETTKFASQEFTYDDSTDTVKPEINITKGDTTGTIKISATDNIRLSYITYKWNEEVETRIDATDDTKLALDQTLDAKEGENTLTITAVDASNNTKIMKKTIKGSKRPEVSIKRVENKLVITASDDDGISKIEYDINGETKTIENINSTQYETSIDLQTGTNYITVRAYDVNGLGAETKGKSTL